MNLQRSLGTIGIDGATGLARNAVGVAGGIVIVNSAGRGQDRSLGWNWDGCCCYALSSRSQETSMHQGKVPHRGDGLGEEGRKKGPFMSLAVESDVKRVKRVNCKIQAVKTQFNQ